MICGAKSKNDILIGLKLLPANGRMGSRTTQRRLDRHCAPEMAVEFVPQPGAIAQGCQAGTGKSQCEDVADRPFRCPAGIQGDKQEMFDFALAPIHIVRLLDMLAQGKGIAVDRDCASSQRI